MTGSVDTGLRAAVPATATISEIYVDFNAIASIQWSTAATFGAGAAQATLVTSTRSAGNIVTTLVPSQMLVRSTYLILSEVSYVYTPARRPDAGCGLSAS